MVIQESAEDYLEAILMLSERIGNVRSIDIVNEIGVTKPSVSRAMKLLRENGYITVESKHYLRLTPKGREIAECIYERHQFLSDFLTSLGVNPAVAVEDACRIEHVISKESFARLKEHIFKMRTCPNQCMGDSIHKKEESTDSK